MSVILGFLEIWQNPATQTTPFPTGILPKPTDFLALDSPKQVNVKFVQARKRLIRLDKSHAGGVENKVLAAINKIAQPKGLLNSFR
jgi:hypothetical protein